MKNPLIKTLSVDNIADEHICCAFSDKNSADDYNTKKAWLKNQFKEGYTFKELDVRGKVYIEYMPAVKAWVPINANNYMLINRFYVSSKNKDQGHHTALYEECLKDTNDKNLDGIALITGNAKKPFMTEKRFFKKKGFLLCDTTEPYFELWYKPLNNSAQIPQFKPCAKMASCATQNGLEIYFTNACSSTAYYFNKTLTDIARERNIQLTIHKLDTIEKAQNHCIPHTNHSVFYNGVFVTNQLLNAKYFDKFLNSKLPHDQGHIHSNNGRT